MELVALRRVPLSGYVVARDQFGHAMRSTVTNGQWAVQLPPGTYTFVGRSPQYQGGKDDCRAVASRIVDTTPYGGPRLPVDVVCEGL
jgi:hypothetical protein